VLYLYKLNILDENFVVRKTLTYHILKALPICASKVNYNIEITKLEVN